MKEEEKLLKVKLSNEQEKENIQKITGFRLYFSEHYIPFKNIKEKINFVIYYLSLLNSFN